MIIDFGNGEAIMARHEEYTQRALEAQELRHRASQAQTRSGRLHHYTDRMRCEMDFWRLALADRLHGFALAQSILHAESTRFFSVRPCS